MNGLLSRLLPTARRASADGLCATHGVYPGDFASCPKDTATAGADNPAITADDLAAWLDVKADVARAALDAGAVTDRDTALSGMADAAATAAMIRAAQWDTGAEAEAVAEA